MTSITVFEHRLFVFLAVLGAFLSGGYQLVDELAFFSRVLGVENFALRDGLVFTDGLKVYQALFQDTPHKHCHCIKV